MKKLSLILVLSLCLIWTGSAYAWYNSSSGIKGRIGLGYTTKSNPSGLRKFLENKCPPTKYLLKNPVLRKVLESGPYKATKPSRLDSAVWRAFRTVREQKTLPTKNTVETAKNTVETAKNMLKKYTVTKPNPRSGLRKFLESGPWPLTKSLLKKPELRKFLFGSGQTPFTSAFDAIPSDTSSLLKKAKEVVDLPGPPYRKQLFEIDRINPLETFLPLKSREAIEKIRWINEVRTTIDDITNPKLPLTSGYRFDTLIAIGAKLREYGASGEAAWDILVNIKSLEKDFPKMGTEVRQAAIDAIISEIEEAINIPQAPVGEEPGNIPSQVHGILTKEGYVYVGELEPGHDPQGMPILMPWPIYYYANPNTGEVLEMDVRQTDADGKYVLVVTHKEDGSLLREFWVDNEGNITESKETFKPFPPSLPGNKHPKLSTEVSDWMGKPGGDIVVNIYVTDPAVIGTIQKMDDIEILRTEYNFNEAGTLSGAKIVANIHADAAHQIEYLISLQGVSYINTPLEDQPATRTKLSYTAIDELGRRQQKVQLHQPVFIGVAEAE